jgi:hypothetical protein
MDETKPESTNVASEDSEQSRREMIGKVFTAMGAVAVGSLLAAPGDAQAQYAPAAPAALSQSSPAFKMDRLQTGGFALRLSGASLATALQREGLKSSLGASSSVTLTWS